MFSATCPAEDGEEAATDKFHQTFSTPTRSVKRRRLSNCDTKERRAEMDEFFFGFDSSKSSDKTANADDTSHESSTTAASPAHISVGKTRRVQLKRPQPPSFRVKLGANWEKSAPRTDHSLEVPEGSSTCDARSSSKSHPKEYYAIFQPTIQNWNINENLGDERPWCYGYEVYPRIMMLSKEEKYIPSAVKTLIVEYLKDDVLPLRDIELYDRELYDGDIPRDTSHWILGHKDNRMLENEFWTIRGIVEETVALDITDSETAWNSAVHHPILKLALQSDSKPKHYCPYGIKNITDATIDPTYLPKDLENVKGHYMNFAYFVQPTQKIPNDVPEYCTSYYLTYPRFNQTINGNLAECFLAMYIVAKSPDGSLAEGRVQLGLWASSHFAKLYEIEDGRGWAYGGWIPSLPLVLVRGTEWSGYIATKGFTEEGQVSIQGPFPLGSASNLRGVYKVVSALRELLGWTLWGTSRFSCLADE